MNIWSKYGLKGRLMLIKAQLGCSTRGDLAEKLRISSATLESWENEVNPMSRRMVKKVEERLAELGISCTEEWLLYGKGMPAYLISNDETSSIIHSIKNINPELSLKGNIIEECKSFYRNVSPTLMVVTDNAMAPKYSENSLVGGIQVQPSEAIYQDVIVELERGDFILRTLRNNQFGPGYSLYVSNIGAHVSEPIMINVKIRRCYKVVWHRVDIYNVTHTKNMEISI